MGGYPPLSRIFWLQWAEIRQLFVPSEHSIKLLGTGLIDVQRFLQKWHAPCDKGESSALCSSTKQIPPVAGGLAR
jgi:hypothetical protein